VATSLRSRYIGEMAAPTVAPRAANYRLTSGYPKLARQPSVTSPEDSADFRS
jgi:hypothetical protein